MSQITDLSNRIQALEDWKKNIEADAASRNDISEAGASTDPSKLNSIDERLTAVEKELKMGETPSTDANPPA